MNSDLLAMLSGAGLGGPSNSNRRETGANEGKTLLSFKAGKMNASLQPNTNTNKYLIKADLRRGELSLNYFPSTPSTSGTLKLEWKDRRTNTIVDSLRIFPQDQCTYTKVDTGRESDRVYLLQYGHGSDRRYFFWMQDREQDRPLDEEHCVKMNLYMTDFREAALAAGVTPPTVASARTAAGSTTAATATNNTNNTLTVAPLLDLAALTRTTGVGAGAGAGAGAAAAGGSISSSSTILTPVPTDASVVVSSETTQIMDITESSSANDTTSNNYNNDNSTFAPPRATLVLGNNNVQNPSFLTLADLQGAMASLATQTPPSSSSSSLTPPSILTELMHPDIIRESQILQNPQVKQRLLALLPPGQQTEEYLMENLNSPPLRACIQTLAMALTPPHSSIFMSSSSSSSSSWQDFCTIVTNLNLRPEDGADSFYTTGGEGGGNGGGGGPIQALFDCIMKSIEREEKEEANDEKEKEEKEEEDTKDTTTDKNMDEDENMYD